MPHNSTTTYQIMHQDQCVATIDETGHAKVLEPAFMPYNLYLEEEDDVDTRVNNLMNFNYWCASRVLTLDRKYAKEILNSIGMSQAVTDRERAKIEFLKEYKGNIIYISSEKWLRKVILSNRV